MSVVLLEDVKTFLNVPDSGRNADLQSLIDAAEAIIVKRIGFLGETDYEDRVRGGHALSFPRNPILTITSITGKSGTAVSLADIFINKGAGVVELDSGESFTEPWYDAVYSIGYATTPDHLTLAVKELVKHLFKSQRGPNQPRTGGDEVPTAGYLLPYRVQSLLDLETPILIA